MSLPPAPPFAERAPARPTVLARVTVALAALAVLGFAAAAVLLAVPVRTPEVQDCGAPATYLLDGEVDVIPDPEGRILGPDDEIVTLDPEVAEAARATPCQERVASRAVPAAALATGAFLVGVTAFAVEVFGVRRALRRSRAASPTLEG